jgi:hypothetical protein
MSEALVQKLLDDLEAELPALLQDAWDAWAAADAADGRTVPLRLPERYWFGLHVPDELAEPIVVAWEEQSELVQEGSGALGAVPDETAWAEERHSLVVAVLLPGDDELVLERQWARYKEALRRFFRRRPALVVGGRSLSLTVEHIGRESRRAQLRIVTADVRGLFADVVAHGLMP